MHSHHRLALGITAAAVILDAAYGLAFAVAEHLPAWHGMYIELANTVTVGGDVNPAHRVGYVINAVAFLTVDPLFAIGLGLFTSGLLDGHVRRAEHRIKAHVESLLGGEEKPDG